jgi:hypothetical protein
VSRSGAFGLPVIARQRIASKSRRTASPGHLHRAQCRIPLLHAGSFTQQTHRRASPWTDTPEALTACGLDRSGWTQRQTILFDPKTIRKALTRLERERVPADRLEIQRVRDSERRHGRSYVPHPRTPKPGIDEIELDFSAVSL